MAGTVAPGARPGPVPALSAARTGDYYGDATERVMSSLANLLCLFCISTSAPPNAPLAREAGDIWYREEMLSGGQHLLRLSTSDRILDSDSWRRQRLEAFAENYAASACGGRYTMLRGFRLTSYAGQAVFRCR